MNGVSAGAARFRLAVAASAVAAAATLGPAGVAAANPPTPLPQASVFTAVTDGDMVGACDPSISICAPQVASFVGNSSVAAAQSPFQNSLFWFGEANPNFQPLFGITFPNFFGLNFQACVLGGGVRLDPYSGTGFIGIGAGC